MAENVWDNFGQQILDTVDDAIRYGDFSNLSRSVGNIINDTIDTIRGTGRSNRQGTYYGGNGPYQQGTAYGNAGRQGQQYQNNGAGQNVRRTAGNRYSQPALYERNPKGKVPAILMCVGGYVAFGIFGILFLALLVIAFADPFVIVGTVFFGVLTAISLAIALRGSKNVRFINRYLSYIRVLQQRVNIPIRELADRVGKSIEYTTRDLKKMIDRRLFFQAHIDEAQHYLILSDEAYNAYRIAQNEYAARAEQQAQDRAQQERKAQETKKADEDLPPECRELIEKGRMYIRHIHESNEAIPGEEISAKLDHMERVVTRIFDVVRVHPEVAPDLNKLMSYYLPTTQKLLDAYRELDSQPVAGEHIQTTKREIEDTIDTLNVAFEKLLDSLFEDRAWDISSDISVLHTILAQDGLKEDGMKPQS